MSSVTYILGKNIYINLTNRCSMACTFCIRQNGETIGDSDTLWLDKEPDFDTVISELLKYDAKNYESVVFCGYGEPLYRADDVIKIARWVKENMSVPVRINTNGHGNYLAKRDLTPELSEVTDQISISLNAPTKEEYDQLCRPSFYNAYEQMLDFARKCVEAGIDTVMSAVDVISDEEEAKCADIARKIGAEFRSRIKE